MAHPGSFESDKGSPRYVWGKAEIGYPKMEEMRVCSSSFRFKGTKVDL
jgi:hypothetical protein